MHHPYKELAAAISLASILLAAPAFADGERAAPAIPFVSGHVTNADGQAVAGADIYARVSSVKYQFEISNPLAMGEFWVLVGKTDAAGAYKIEGDAKDGGWSKVTLYARTPGFPMVRMTASPVGGSTRPGKGTVAVPLGSTQFQGDLVLPTQHTKLTVHVLRDGKPVPGAWVTLNDPDSQQGRASTRLVWVAASLIVGVDFLPTASADENGDATFTDIPQGVWNIFVKEAVRTVSVAIKPGLPCQTSVTLHRPAIEK